MLGADRIEVVAIPADCIDGFNWAYWRRPHAYLDPEVRACISGLALLDDDLVARRMERLGADLEDGTWESRHGHLLGLDSIDGGLPPGGARLMRLEDIDLTDLDRFVGGFPDDVFTDLRDEAPVWWHPPTRPHARRHRLLGGEQPRPGSRGRLRRRHLLVGGSPDAAGGGTLIEDLPFGFAAGVLLNMMDDPRHQRIRRLVTPAVAPRALALLEGELRARTAAILDACPTGGAVTS